MTIGSSVKYFHSQMTGAPQLTATAGSGIALLDSLLISGFNNVTFTTLTQAAGVATATVASGHGYEINQTITILGADQTGYNGEHVILSVPSPTTFTFAVPSGTVSPATTSTSIAAKVTPLGWAKIQSGTNLAMYQSVNSSSTGNILYVDDTPTQFMRVCGCESAIGSGALASNMVRSWPQSPYTTAAGYSWGKQTDGSGNTHWYAIGDDLGFYLYIGWDINNFGTYYDYEQYWFGDIISNRPSDSYACALFANVQGDSLPSQGPGQYCAIGYGALSTGSALNRSFTGVQANVQCFRGMAYGPQGGTISGYNVVNYGVNPVDNTIIVGPQLSIYEAAGPWNYNTYAFRGYMPGIYQLLTNRTLPERSVITGLANLPGLTLMQKSFGYASQIGAVMHQLFGPWR